VELEEIYKFDKTYMAQSMFETSEIPDHPGVKQVYALADNFLAGKIWLINEPVFQEPFDKFFFTPEQMREKFHRRHWQRVVAFHSSTVPHMGHEWIMKGAWFQHKAKAVLASCIVGDKRLTDCIDETVVLGHQALQDSGYMRESMHMTSIFLWDKRYAGSREAVVHAIVRKNLGCTGHIFGKNHALPREYVGDTYAAAFVFKHLPEIGIESVPVKEWFFCKHCNGVTYSSFCGHATAKDEFKSENVCSLLSTGIKPTEHLLRPEVFDTIIGAADKYGFGDGYVTEEYLQRRNPIFLLHKF
jgi:sulfate adenylyltransferase